MDTTTTETEPAAIKQPDRIATSKIEKYLDESREYLAATQQSAEEAATQADLAVHFARKVHDSNFYIICLLALFGGGLALAQLITFLIIILVAVTHGFGW